MKLSIFVELTSILFLIGCASTNEVITPDGRGAGNGQSLQMPTFNVSAEVGDSTHPGGTWKEERDSVKKQIHLVTLVIIVVALVVLAFTLGTAGKGG